MIGDALLSGESPPRYRYWLTRRWSDPPARTLGTVVVIGLNPSTADAKLNDMTITKCVGFARKWGYGDLAMYNLYALRSTKPSALKAADDPIGPENDAHLLKAFALPGLIVAAWGENVGPDPMRVATVLGLIGDRPIYCLGTTKHGQPRHPSRIGYDTALRPFIPTNRPVSIEKARHVEPAPHHFDQCECGHLREFHRTASCLGSSFKRGGGGRQVGDTHSSVCNCQGFVSNGRRFVPAGDPKLRRAIAHGQAPADYPLISELIA